MREMTEACRILLSHVQPRGSNLGSPEGFCPRDRESLSLRLRHLEAVFRSENEETYCASMQGTLLPALHITRYSDRAWVAEEPCLSADSWLASDARIAAGIICK